jgi:hypothetical protein
MNRLRLPGIFVLLWLCTGLAFGQTFNPADYGNVTLHLKADTLALANGNAVSTWGPLSAIGTATPTYVAADVRFNGKPVVRFDGVDDVLKFTSANLNAQTIFVVGTMESAATSLAGLISNGSDQLNIRRNGTALYYRCVGQAMDGNDFVGAAPTGNLYVNNVVSGPVTAGSAHLVMAVAGGMKTYASFWLGSASASLGRYWNGSVAEVLIYDGALTQEGINRVGYYLQSKYNLPTTFPLPNPDITSFTATAGAITSGKGVLSTAGAPVTLAWNVQNVTTLEIDNGALAPTAAATGSVVVSPTTTTTYKLTATNNAGPSTRSVTVHIGATVQSPVISEFMANPDGEYPDEDGIDSDWIEIYNPNPFAIDLQGYQLKDEAALWVFPANTAIDGGGYRVVFASGNNRIDPTKNLHTNFALKAGGEYLALLKPDGSVATAFAPAFPPQQKGASGATDSSGVNVFYPVPTPGAVNGPSVLGFVGDTAFSVNRGFFTAPFQVAITTPTVGATIRYTTNGSTPSLTNGLTYTAPINVTSSTILRARAFFPNFEPTNTDTHSYIFLNSVLNQVYSSPPSGWPVSGLNGQTMRYGFNATLKEQYTVQQLLGGLSQVPSISIVTDQANLTDATTGIYVNALSKGDEWERAASIEYLDPTNVTQVFQVNAGLRIRGGYSRNDQYAKHSFRLFFRKKYGDSKLDFPLHGNSGTSEFETIDLRTEQNYHWANDASGTQNTAVREVFCRDLMGALGQPTSRTRPIHVYLNGQYWGLYQTEERVQQDYGAEYFGGSADDYDVLQTSNHPNFTYEVANGTVTAWQNLWNLSRAHATSPTVANYFKILGRNPAGERDPALPVYLDVDNLIAYMLLHYYTGDGDGPLSNFLAMNRANNWRGMRSRVDDVGFRFFVHDSEHTLQASSWVDNRANTAAPSGSNRSVFTYSNPEWIHEDLSGNAEYRIRFADLAQKYLFNNGPMTPVAAQGLFDARATQINQAIIADVARWGQSATSHTLAQWNTRLNTIRTSFFPSRTAALLGHLRTRGFFPQVNAPTFSQRGGQVAAGYSLTMSQGAQTGSIYYTVDGSDPRAIGGAPVGQVFPVDGVIISAPTLVRARFRSSGGVWSALDEAYFTTFAPAAAGKLVISKLHYHPTDPTSQEIAAGYNSESDFEYIELQNISGETIDLRSLSFTDGVTFSFANSSIQTLAAGGKILVAGNSNALASRFGPGLPIAGQYAGDLSNDGEFIRLAGTGNVTVIEFTYVDSGMWPEAADGSGYALILKDATTNPDPNNVTNWRSSYAPGGKPGGVDVLTVADWRSMHFAPGDLADPAKEATVWGDNADPDGDGATNAEEFAAGTDPLDAFDAFYADVLKGATGMIIRFPVKANRAYAVEYKSTIGASEWLPLSPSVPAQVNDGVFDFVDPAGVSERFYRVKTWAP